MNFTGSSRFSIFSSTRFFMVIYRWCKNRFPESFILEKIAVSSLNLYGKNQISTYDT